MTNKNQAEGMVDVHLIDCQNQNISFYMSSISLAGIFSDQLYSWES